MTTLSIVIPAYNERPTLLPVLGRVLATDLRPLGVGKQVIVVDDCSTDGTRDIVARLDGDWRAALRPVLERQGADPDAAMEGVEVRGVLHPVNRGKGAALRSGFQHATGDFVLVQDADLEYDPRDYPALLRPLLEDRADVVYGSRFLASERRVLLFWHSVGNQLLTLLSNAVTDLNLTDMETGYKVFRTDVIRNLKLESERFGFEPEVTAKVAKMRYRIFEVPVSYSGRGYESGKKITWKDGVEAVWCILKYGLSNDIVDGPVLDETLQKMSGMRHFNRHLYETIRPWLGAHVLEAGSGHGAITDYLVRAASVVATDPDDAALRRLRSAYSLHDNVQVLRWHMAEPAPPGLAGAVDTVVCLNVLEQVEDEGRALENARRLLEPRGGRLVLMVPAHPRLFSPLDERLGHRRRYTRAQLQQALARAGFDVEHVQWFNLLGLAGWWLNGRVLGRDRFPHGQLGLYASVSRLGVAAEGQVDLPVGLSLLAVARPARASS